MFLRFKTPIRGGTLVREETDPGIIAKLLAKNWEEFTPAVVTPPTVIPTEVPAWAFRAALRVDGSLAQVTAAIAALPAVRQAVAQERLSGPTPILRSSKLIAHIATTVPFTSAKLDTLFTNADLIASDKLGD